MEKHSNILSKLCLIILLFLCINSFLYGQEITTVAFSDQQEEMNIGKNVWIMVDSTEKMNIKDVINSEKFESNNEDVPTFWFTSATIWFKFKIKNNSSNEDLLLKVGAPLIDETALFYADDHNQWHSTKIGQTSNFYERKYKQPEYIYDLNLKPEKENTFYLSIKSHDQIQVPLHIMTANKLFTSFTTYNFVFGIYCGVMIIMILYNLFVYFTVKDKSYLYYVLYIIAVTLTQTTFQGYTFKYLWPSSPQFETQSILLMSVFVGFTSVEFLRVFTNTRLYTPKLDKVFLGAYIVYSIITVLIFLKMYQISWIMILSLVSPLSLFMLYVGARIAYKGYRPAKFFTASWSIFLVGVFVYAMKDFGILPHNNITIYTMPVGSAIETVLLSFALADRINIYKKERVEALEEKERVVREQNVILEQKVVERTSELNQTLKHLKEAQSQLVDAEKMSSLGQLTAGIAHEINNPINFVSSNINPLRQDLKDIDAIIAKYEELSKDNFEDKLNEIEELKKELDFDYLKTELNTIINGIEDGAVRTKEIVSGLRNFSRLDEVELQKANINEGINSTLVLIKNRLNGIVLKKNHGNLPMILCYPGKLNQLFMNLINNAIHAIEEKDINNEDGLININTFADEHYIYIKVKDNGIGMSTEVKEKIFEPFFTTKDVGQGVGLGLSISYSIIETHHGEIHVTSEKNIGTEITVKIPIKQQ